MWRSRDRGDGDKAPLRRRGLCCGTGTVEDVLGRIWNAGFGALFGVADCGGFSAGGIDPLDEGDGCAALGLSLIHI